MTWLRRPVGSNDRPQVREPRPDVSANDGRCLSCLRDDAPDGRVDDAVRYRRQRGAVVRGWEAVVFWAVVGGRLLLPLLILRFPLPAVLACLVLDAADQSIFQAFGYDP